MSTYRTQAALQAVCFDMDGLLVDSERLWYEVEHDVMRRLGGSWSEEHQRTLVGGPITRTVAFMLELSGSTVPPSRVGRWLMEGMEARLRADVPLLPGARELLDEVAASGVPCALVSSAYRVLVEAALDAIGRDTFTMTVAGDEVTRLKPDPEPYLTAVRRLGATPSRCVVLEDSPNGVAAAEAAGCVTVAVPSIVPIEPRTGRTVVRSLDELDVARLEALVQARWNGAAQGR